MRHGPWLDPRVHRAAAGARFGSQQSPQGRSGKRDASCCDLRESGYQGEQMTSMSCTGEPAATWPDAWALPQGHFPEPERTRVFVTGAQTRSTEGHPSAPYRPKKTWELEK